MPARELSHHPAVAMDLWEARVWYARVDPRLAERFMQEFWHSVETACAAPERWAMDDRGKRRVRFQSFPYLLVFRLEGTAVRVLAVAHGSRSPDFWRHRR